MIVALPGLFSYLFCLRGRIYPKVRFLNVWLICILWYEPGMTEPTKWHVRPAKTSLIRVFAVRSIGS